MSHSTLQIIEKYQSRFEWREVVLNLNSNNWLLTTTHSNIIYSLTLFLRPLALDKSSNSLYCFPITRYTQSPYTICETTWLSNISHVTWHKFESLQLIASHQTDLHYPLALIVIRKVFNWQFSYFPSSFSVTSDELENVPLPSLVNIHRCLIPWTLLSKHRSQQTLPIPFPVPVTQF